VTDHPAGPGRPRHQLVNLLHLISKRRNKMNLINEELARAQMSARLGEAHAQRRGQRLVMARRLSRRAERAAQEARLAIARSL
jgi:hypothetical protein